MKLSNSIKQVILLALLGMGMNSCLDLDPVVYDQISPENFYKTESDAKAAVTAIYSPLGSPGDIYGGWTETFWMINNLCADDMGTQRDDYEFMEKFQWNSTTYAAYKFYNLFVKEAHRATLVIDDLQNSPIADDVKTKYIAEVQCIRGQYLFFLYDFYGTANITTDAEILRNPQSEVILERLPQDEFIKLIESDLKAAAGNLPLTYDASEYGRLSKGAAYTILAKLYMQEKRWADAEEYCRKIQELKYYALQDKYQSVFSIENERNNEIIWALPCHSEIGNGNSWTTHVLPPELPSFWTNSKVQRWNVYNMLWGYYDHHFQQEGDERASAPSLITEFEYVSDGKVKQASRYNGYANLRKGALPVKYPEDPTQISEKAGNDVVVYRYADVVLELAEAINEQNGPTTEAVGLVELIRARAGIPNTIPAEATANKEVFRDFVLDERGRELYCEGHRRRDLIRHGKWIQSAVDQGYIPAGREADYQHLVLFPVPQEVIDESQGKIKQNEGY